MPYSNVPPDLTSEMDRCVESVMEKQGYEKERAIAICHAAIVKGDTDALKVASDSGFKLTDLDYQAVIRYLAAKFMAGVKAIGDWELDVTAIPFSTKDADQQWFDENTDIMPDVFKTPVVIYQHSIKQGATGYQDKPEIIGTVKPNSLEKQADGWHIRVILDRAKAIAETLMSAARRGLLAVSSGTIQHLARLDVNGKSVPYEKDKPGRIAVWPFAEISLWEMGNNNFRPANRFAVAVPAMKAIYQEAGLSFPDLDASAAAEARLEARLAEIKKLHESTDIFLKKLGEIK